MDKLIAAVARGLVDAPEKVEVFSTPGEDSTLIELRVAEEDLGKVIGKNGRTARAMRSLLTAVGMRDRHRYDLEILDD